MTFVRNAPNPMSRRDMFTSVLVRELYDVYLKISRHTYDIGIIVDLIPVSDRYNSRSYTGIRRTPCEYAVGSMRVRTRVSMVAAGTYGRSITPTSSMSTLTGRRSCGAPGATAWAGRSPPFSSDTALGVSSGRSSDHATAPLGALSSMRGARHNRRTSPL